MTPDSAVETCGDVSFLQSDAEATVRSAVTQILHLQADDGCWDAPCEFDPSETATYLLFTHYMGRAEAKLDSELVRYLRCRHEPSGGWAAYPGGPPVLDSTVLCYAAMRAAGVSASDSVLTRSRSVIRELGGLELTSLLTRAWLVLTGQSPVRVLGHYSPRLAGTSRRLAFMQRRIGVCILGALPMLVLSARSDAIRQLPRERSIDDLLVDGVRRKTPPTQVRPHGAIAGGHSKKTAMPANQQPVFRRLKDVVSWRLSVIGSAVARWTDRWFPSTASEQRVVQAILDFQEADGSFGELTGPTCLNLMALATVDATVYHEPIERGCDWLRRQLVQTESGMRQQISPSSTHVSAFAYRALRDVGLRRNADNNVADAADWLLEHEAKSGGDWGRDMPQKVERAGWAFGKTCADTDSTAIVLAALDPVSIRESAATTRAARWLLTMQDTYGGWAVYSANARPIRWFPTDLYSPIINDLIRPEADVTARILLALAEVSKHQPDLEDDISEAVARGLDFLWRERRQDGSWFGRWATNYTYGTGQVLEAMIDCGVDRADPRLVASTSWLKSVQNEDGGWGESKNSYLTGRYEAGNSNPLTTCFCVGGLMSVVGPDDASVNRGLQYFLRTRETTGLWEDHDWNGVSLPGAAYIRYRLTPTCLCVSALARWLREKG